MPHLTNVASSSPTIGTTEILSRIGRDAVLSVNSISLTAYESCLSQTSKLLMGGPFYGRYHLGVSGYRDIDDQHVCLTEGLMRASMPAVSALEERALASSKSLFGAKASELRPLSGLHAMLCVVGSLTEPGDVVMSVAPHFGGHSSTASLIGRLGRIPAYIPWSPDNYEPDIERTVEECKRLRNPMILVDVGATLFPIPIKTLRAAVGPSYIIAYDASHIMGLIAGGVFPNPLADGADILFGNTHKSFPGPQKGMIHYANETLAQRGRDTIGRAFISSQHTGDSLALYVTLLEMEQFGKAYAEAMIRNAHCLSTELERQGTTIFKKDGVITQSSCFWVIPKSGMTSSSMCTQLIKCGILTNSRNHYGTELLRIGTQYVSRQGMGEHAMGKIAYLWKEALSTGTAVDKLRREVEEFMLQFNQVHYSFDTIL